MRIDPADIREKGKVPPPSDYLPPTRPAKIKVKLADGKERAIQSMVATSFYVAQGVGELDSEKLSPLLRLRYSNAIADAVKDLGSADEVRRVFVGFQRHLY